MQHSGFPKARHIRYCPGLDIRSDMRDVFIRCYGGLARESSTVWRCAIAAANSVVHAQQRLWMTWLYARLSVVSALAITGTDLFRVIVRFVLKVHASRLRAFLQALIGFVERALRRVRQDRSEQDSH